MSNSRHLQSRLDVKSTRKAQNCSVSGANMNSLPLLVCLSMALIHQGLCLSCFACSNDTGTTCTGVAIPCTTGEVCSSLYTYNTGEKMFSVYKACSPSSICDSAVSFLLGSGRYNSWYSCCSKDNCVTSDAVVGNGLYCPFWDSTTNSSVQVLECTGVQTQCFNETRKKTDGITSTLGCSSVASCATSIGNYPLSSCQNATVPTTTPTTTTPTTTTPTTTTPTTTTPTTTTPTTTTPTTTTPTTSPTTTATQTTRSASTPTSTTKTTAAMNSASLYNSPSTLYSQVLLLLLGLFSVCVSDRIVNFYM
ncbi:threonine-rich protein-like [Dendropsophus ebraccatus]|uniref:threonine-rich protein-like n=1 Tax=Dendropsophus ebraccatus TaxID=150705 RepID=UPI0038317338